MIKAILFDLADTLLQFDHLDHRALFMMGAKDTYRHLHDLNIPLPKFEVYTHAHFRAFRRKYIWSHIRRRDFNVNNVICRVLTKLDIPVNDADIPELVWRWYRPVVRRATVESGTRGMLREFQRRGLKLAIVSNTCAPDYCLDRHLERERLLEFFPTRIYSSNTFYRKPHPMIFQAALDDLAIPAAHAMFVGDLLGADIKGARRAGMTTVWKPAERTKTTRRRRVLPDYEIKKITDLADIVLTCGIEA
ncbi:MAG: HAD family hydrolase [Phycisphaerae bacterium]